MSTEHVYYRCDGCGVLVAPEQIEPADDLGPPEDAECACWKGPNWKRGVWRAEK